MRSFILSLLLCCYVSAQDTTTNLVVHWKLQDNAADQIIVAEVGPTGTLQGTGTTADLRVTGPGPGAPFAIRFNGTDNLVDSGALGFTPTYPISFSCWVNNELDDSRSFIGVSGITLGTRFLTMITHSNDKWHFERRNTVTYYATSLGLTTQPLSTWKHIGGVMHSDTEVEGFLNGVSLGKKSALPSVLLTSIDRFNVGARRVLSPNWFFQGGIADARMYNARALTAADFEAIRQEGLSSPSDPVVIDMGAPTARQLYNFRTSTLLNGLTTATVEAAIETLVVNNDYNGYDWSGVGLCHTTNGTDISVNCDPLMISETHAMGSGHCAPAVGQRVYFLNPAGQAVYGTIEARYELPTYTEMRIIRFTANPDPTLKRYKYVSNASFYHNGKMWNLDYDADMRLTNLTVGSTSSWQTTIINWNNGDSGFDQGKTLVNSGSGKPSLIALDNGEMYIVGQAFSGGSTGIGITRPDLRIDSVNSYLAGKGELILMYEVPGLNQQVPGTETYEFANAPYIKGSPRVRSKDTKDETDIHIIP